MNQKFITRRSPSNFQNFFVFLSSIVDFALGIAHQGSHLSSTSDAFVDEVGDVCYICLSAVDDDEEAYNFETRMWLEKNENSQCNVEM